MEFINIDRILWDSKIVKPLPTSSVKLPKSMVTYKLTSSLSTNISNFIKSYF